MYDCMCGCIFFFFQAEDGIRSLTVTGVQTCALPIARSGACASTWPRPWWRARSPQDRKSTRLNSSHSQNSYAVFCLKKKKKKKSQYYKITKKNKNTYKNK